MAVFWDVAPCSLVETDRRFRGPISSYISSYSLPRGIFIVLMMEAVSTSEMSSYSPLREPEISPNTDKVF
jgi:hypothetical protein